MQRIFVQAIIVNVSKQEINLFWILEFQSKGNKKAVSQVKSSLLCKLARFGGASRLEYCQNLTHTHLITESAAVISITLFSLCNSQKMQAFPLHPLFVFNLFHSSVLLKCFRRISCKWFVLVWKCHHFAFSLCYLKILLIPTDGCYLNMSAHLAVLPTTLATPTWRTKRPLNKPITIIAVTSQPTWKCTTNATMTDRTEPIVGANSIICMAVYLCTADVFILNPPLKLPGDYLKVVARSPRDAFRMLANGSPGVLTIK